MSEYSQQGRRGLAGPADLPKEVWSRVFTHLQPGYEQATPAYHAAFHALRQVCQQFRDVFCANPQLSRHLCVPDHEDSKVTSNMLDWLRHNVHNIESYECDAKLVRV